MRPRVCSARSGLASDDHVGRDEPRLRQLRSSRSTNNRTPRTATARSATSRRTGFPGVAVVQVHVGVDANNETRLQAISKNQLHLRDQAVISPQFNQLADRSHNLWGRRRVLIRTWAAPWCGNNLNARRLQQEFVQGNTLLADQPFADEHAPAGERPTPRATFTPEGISPGDVRTSTISSSHSRCATTAHRRSATTAGATGSPRRERGVDVHALPAGLGLTECLRSGKLRAAYGEVGQSRPRISC